MNEETNKGCGSNCKCAGGIKAEDLSCEAPKEGVRLDKDGKCPCGKSSEDCCHRDTIMGAGDIENDALHELCEPHNGKHVCDVDSDLAKTAT